MQPPKYSTKTVEIVAAEFFSLNYETDQFEFSK